MHVQWEQHKCPTNRHVQHARANEQRRRHDGPQTELRASLVGCVVHGSEGVRADEHVGVVPAAGTGVGAEALVHAVAGREARAVPKDDQLQDSGHDRRPLVAIAVDAPTVAKGPANGGVPRVPACGAH